MQNVMGMFNQTLDVEKNFGWGGDQTGVDDFEDEFAVQNGAISIIIKLKVRSILNVYTLSSLFTRRQLCNNN